MSGTHVLQNILYTILINRTPADRHTVLSAKRELEVYGQSQQMWIDPRELFREAGSLPTEIAQRSHANNSVRMIGKNVVSFGI